MILRYTGPCHAPGALEAWNEAAWRFHAEVAWPVYKTAGAVSWLVTNDAFGNTPRTMQMIEFASAEKAMAAIVSPEMLKLKEQFLALGTLDLQVAIHVHTAEGK